MNKILVTGGAGFIGTALVQELIEKDFDIVVYDNLSTGNTSGMSSWINRTNCHYICADMLDPLTLMRAAEGCEIVFHLAANPDVRLATHDTKIDFDQNVIATYNLLEVMRKSPSCKKIVFTSSSTVYGEPAVMPTPETYPTTRPISLYGATKLACESLIAGYCYMYNMAGIALRLANVIGPSSNHGVIYDFITKLTRTPTKLQILGNGSQNKSYLFIEDCISAIEVLHSLLKNTQSNFDVFNAGSEDQITVMEIAKIVIDELSLSDVSMSFEGRRDGRGWAGDVREMLLHSSKLNAFGWKINYTSKDAVIKSARGIVRTLETLKHTNRAKTDVNIEAKI